MSTVPSLRGSSASRLGEEDGVGLIGTISGALVFLTFMFMATHVVVHLFATSVATSAAFEAARAASAEGPGGLSAARYAAAEARGLALLGDVGAGATMEVAPVGTERVQATVRLDSPVVFGPLVQAVPGLATINRTAEYRLEAPVDPP